jgi:ribosomal protein S17
MNAGTPVETPNGKGEVVSSKMTETVLVIHRRPPDQRDATRGAFYFKIYDKGQVKETTKASA